MVQESPAHIAIVTTPGMGLLIPMVQFAKHLQNFHGFHVTCIIPTLSGPLLDKMKSALPSSVNQVFLPPVSLHDLPEGADTGTLMSDTIALSYPYLQNVLKPLVQTNRLVGLFGDVFSIPVVFDLAKEFNVSPYMFFSSSMEMSWMLSLPEIDSVVAFPDQIELPGCGIPIPVKDLPGLDQKSSPIYRFFVENSKRLGSSVKGIVVNGFVDLQPGLVRLQGGPGYGYGYRYPPVYPIGPLVQVPDMDSSDHMSHLNEVSNCIDSHLKWLDKQPRGSVLFVSFGSGGTLSQTQTEELAMGLEMSGHRFLWVVRSPNDESPCGAYLGEEKPKSPCDYLPYGFMERTKGAGVLVTSWARQPQILSHSATGGFLTHCGWNSIVESIVNGVPLIAWPLFAEQSLNAFILTEDVKVAVRPKVGKDGVVRREEVAEVVKELMEGDGGKRVRKRMEELKEAAAKAVGEGGSSNMAFSRLAIDLLDN